MKHKKTNTKKQKRDKQKNLKSKTEPDNPLTQISNFVLIPHNLINRVILEQHTSRRSQF